jgi:hypothetical protein
MARDAHDGSTGARSADATSADGATQQDRLETHHDGGDYRDHGDNRHQESLADDFSRSRGLDARRRDADDRAHARFGGIKWGAAFFGWLSANGLNVILLALATAAGAAVGLTETTTAEARSNAETIGIVGGIVLLVILAGGYVAGGYVAGRMSRFDGARQGLATWLIGLVVVLVLAAAGVLLGAQYNVLQQLNLPRIPIDEGTATTAGVVTLVAILLVTLVGAVLGGKLGERYHRKVDRAGLTA